MPDATPTAVQRLVAALAHGRPLRREEVGTAFDQIMRGDATAVQIAAVLTGLRVRGETADVIAGAAQALRRAMVSLPLPDPSALVDTCGTGGGAVGTFNISTAAALVAAGCGVPVAKHGNRSFTSRSGSADVLEALGVRVDADVASMQRAFAAAGIVFMFAPRMHPAMRHVGPVRRELAVPTVMNVVGPLANPAGAGRQVVGVADAGRVDTIADALAELGTVHSLVVHGAPGMDEISPLGPTRVVELRGAERREWHVDPVALGFRPADATEIGGGDPADNARLVEACLDGRARPGAITAVALNAGAAVYVAGIASSFPDGVQRALAAMHDGSARAALDRLRQVLPMA